MFAFRHCCALFCCIVQSMARNDEVRMPPTIIEETGKNGIFRDDVTYTMKCVAHGIPAPEYRWLRNGAPLDFNKENLHKKEDGTFEINPTTSLDEGFYRCTAENQYGTVISNTTHLQRAVLSDSEKRKTIVYATVGKPFHLQVTPPRCFPAPTFSWEIGKEVDNSPRRVEVDNRIQISDAGDLHFGFVKQSDATDKEYYYKLIVFNAYRDVKAHSAYIQLVVSPGSNPSAEPAPSAPTVGFTSATPTNAVVGRNVTLRCFFNGNPSPHIQWQRSDGKPLPVNRHKVRNFQTELFIDKVEFSDEGPYTCKTKNDIGADEATLYINVEAAPIFRNEADRPHNVNVTEGQTVNISCNAVGEPEATIVWLRNGEILRPANLPAKFSLSNNNKLLTIRNLSKNYNVGDVQTDLQVIQCNSSNKHGYALGTGYINVLLKTKIDGSSPIEVFVNNSDGARFEFPCSATADASTPVTVTWYHSESTVKVENSCEKSVVVATNGSLIFHLAANDTYGWTKHRGIYRCRASNEYSEDFLLAIINVVDVGPTTVTTETSKAGMELWLIAVIIAQSLFIIVLIVCYILRCKRNRRDSYLERRNENDPKEEMHSRSFQNYDEPRHQTIEEPSANTACESTIGARHTSLNSDGKRKNDDDGSINVYEYIDAGNLKEDGPFVAAYTELIP